MRTFDITGRFVYSDGDRVETPDETGINNRQRFLEYASRLYDSLVSEEDVVSATVTYTVHQR